jgi:CDP-diacylglycerol--serine O-phosphatidyltransferase
MQTPFPPYDPHGLDETDHDEGRGPRLREIPFRMLIPNLITVLAICAGMTGIRLAFENHIQLAVAMVLVAAFLDGVDGRVARLLKAQSKFGAQMDSLADIINFGVAPALVLYVFILDQARSFGWIAAIVFAIAAGLRLARFNVISESPKRSAWQSYYFVGVPAPAGAHSGVAAGLSRHHGHADRPEHGVCGFRLHHVHRVPADQPRSGVLGQGPWRRGAPRPGHAFHSDRGGLCVAADELHLGDADTDSARYLASLPFGARAWSRKYGPKSRSAVMTPAGSRKPGMKLPPRRMTRTKTRPVSLYRSALSARWVLTHSSAIFWAVT